MIDTVSGGRLVAGFPVGLPYDACINNGIPPIELRPRFDENLELVLRAWREDDAVCLERHVLPAALGQHLAAPAATPASAGLAHRHRQPGDDADRARPRLRLQLPQLVRRQGDGTAHLRPVLGARRQAGVAAQPLSARPHAGGRASPRPTRRPRGSSSRTSSICFHKGPGAIKAENLAIPGTIGLQGLQALMRDPSDFGIADKLRTVGFDELVDMGSVIVGSPATVLERLVEFVRRFRIGNLHAMLQFGSMPRQLAMDNIGLFAAEVLPTLRGFCGPTSAGSTTGGPSGWADVPCPRRPASGRREAGDEPAPRRGRARPRRLGRAHHAAREDGRTRRPARVSAPGERPVNSTRSSRRSVPSTASTHRKSQARAPAIRMRFTKSTACRIWC